MFDQKQPAVGNESPGECPGREERVVVRRFRPSDLQQIIPIEDAAFPVDAFPEAEFRRLSTAHPDEFFVAEISGALVGYVAGSVMGDCGELESVAVDQRLRGRGIGTGLIGRLLDRFQHIGLRRCVLQVRTTNVLAIDLYKRLGFHIVRSLVAYYAEGGDALLMEKTLSG
jgi:ribosomal-protein-alanine N-acetyltransferase